VPVIVTTDLAKHYGPIEALKGVSLTVERGEIFGLLGQNGAGKTTLIKLLLGIARSTAGQATLLGETIGIPAARRRVGYLPEDHRFPDYHTGASLLDFYGALYEVPAAERRRRIPEVLELVGLKGRMHTKIRTYSKGMKQRLGIAQSILHEPEVVFLDEPTDGVDPVGRRHIRDLMQALKAEGKTIFLNSHLLGEVELVCDRVAILQQGELIRAGSIAELTEQRGLYVIGLADGQTFPQEEVAARGYNVTRNEPFWEVTLKDGQNIDPVVDLLRTRGLSLRHLVEKRQSLEDLFVQTVELAEPGVDRAPRPRRSAPPVGEGSGGRSQAPRPPSGAPRGKQP
jgi:ABC-2 type transport system ATP-binding protein